MNLSSNKNDWFKYISNSQQRIVSDLLKKNGFDSLDVVDYLQQEYGIKKVSDIERTAYKSLVSRLGKKQITPADIVEPDDVPL
tara:strand:+ start:167 stop:415 length:249 start_codon:yes stop_codon:yes gene_type:complete